MTRFSIVVAALLSPMVGGFAATAEEWKSGPEAGSRIPGIFRPTAVFYAADPDKNDELINPACHYGPNPTVMIFVRGVGPELAKLINQLDAAVLKHKDSRLGVCVVLLTDEEPKAAAQKLRDIQESEKTTLVTLAYHPAAGPDRYRIAKEAEWTVLLYKKYLVAVNHAFKKDDVTDKAANQVIAELGKIVPMDQ